METTIGSKIMGLRRLRGLSQTDLGKMAGLSVHQVSRIETGRTGPKLAQVEALAMALGVAASDLVGRRVKSS